MRIQVAAPLAILASFVFITFGWVVELYYVKTLRPALAGYLANQQQLLAFKIRVSEEVLRI